VLCDAYHGVFLTASRSLNNYQAQWLAVGNNEGRVHLINTLTDPMGSINNGTQDVPSWNACVGSIFELKWRFDDEVIATGGSDYAVRLWSPETGVSLLCCDKGVKLISSML
jgi:denticleless